MQGLKTAYETKTTQSSLVALFVSDVHMHPNLPRTNQAFVTFLNKHASQARQLYLLGDLFEYWAGDDDIDTLFHQEVVHALRSLSDSGVELFWIAGNRDFLVGEEFAKETGISLLADPATVTVANHRIILTHGDALCTDDTSYMQFRSQVREEHWQSSFLALPLAHRKQIIEGMRQNSKDSQRSKTAAIMDVNLDATLQLFVAADTCTMIHGHTHRPARHTLDINGQQLTRFVLPDWVCENTSMRGGWIGIDATGILHRYDINGDEIL